MYVQAPPRIRSLLPCGVSIPSYATDPTTTNDIVRIVAAAPWTNNTVQICCCRYIAGVRFLVVSDTHANWHALEAVLTDAEGRFDQVVCCGDLVGYNAQPARVLEWTRANAAHTIRGNHDKVVAGL